MGFGGGRSGDDRGVTFSIKSPSFHQLVKSLQSHFNSETVESSKTHTLLKSPELPFQVFLGNLKNDYVLMSWQFKESLPLFSMVKREELNIEELERRKAQELFFHSKNLDRSFAFDGELSSDFASIVRSQK